MTPSDTQLTSLARELGDVLLARGARVACVESCTGGWIAKTLTDVPGSSAWFGWGWVTYANEAKRQLVGVPEAILVCPRRGQRGGRRRHGASRQNPERRAVFRRCQRRGRT